SAAASSASSRPTPTGTPPPATSSMPSPRARAGTWARPSTPSSTAPVSRESRPASAAGATARCCSSRRTAGCRPVRPATAPGRGRLPGCPGWGRRGKAHTRCALLDTRTAELKLEERACPDWVLPNAGYGGYYRLQLDPPWRARLLRSGKLDAADWVGLLGDTD